MRTLQIREPKFTSRHSNATLLVVSLSLLLLVGAGRAAAAQDHTGQYQQADIEFRARLYNANCTRCHAESGDGVAEGMAQSEKIQLAATANDKDNFGHVFIPAFKDALVDHHAENGQFVDLVFSDDQLIKALNALMLDRVYERLRPSDDATAARAGAQQ